MNDELNVGFIGFGEAGFHLAKGLHGAGLVKLFAYDINTQTPRLGEKIQQRALESGTTLLHASGVLARPSNLLLSTVTANEAVPAATQTAPFLESRHLYADLNSVSPALKQSIERIVKSRGARFVEAAIMSPVPPHGHRVPMLLGGPDAQVLIDLLAPYGMHLEVISDLVGAAAATKMCRSIIVKGLEALVLECVLAATPYGADERVFASLDETFPGFHWRQRADYMVSRVVEHGERRAREMEEVAETLRAIGVEPIMAEATARRQDWCARLNLRAHFRDEVPESYREVLATIANILGDKPIDPARVLRPGDV
jgi:3-hydroxyisobutyrate dehydrogenase-like beta-hydroxyacid dehydrogenase